MSPKFLENAGDFFIMEGRLAREIGLNPSIARAYVKRIISGYANESSEEERAELRQHIQLVGYDHLITHADQRRTITATALALQIELRRHEGEEPLPDSTLVVYGSMLFDQLQSGSDYPTATSGLKNRYTHHRRNLRRAIQCLSQAQ